MNAALRFTAQIITVPEELKIRWFLGNAHNRIILFPLIDHFDWKFGEYSTISFSPDLA